MTIRLGAIGVGGMGGGHLNAAASLTDDFAVVAVCDVNTDLVQRAAAAHKATPYSDFHELIARESLDAALITLPHALYRDATVAALGRGWHVFKEKPVGRTLEDARAIRDAARKAGKCVMIAGQSKYAPAFIEAKKIADSGALGDVFLATGLITYRWGGAIANQWGWRGSHAQSGGVAVIDSGWHVLDLMHWYRGMPSRVYAVTGRMKAAPQSDYDVDDKAVVTMEYLDGGIGQMTVTFVAQPSEKRIVLYGTDGTLDISDSRVRHWTGNEVQDVALGDPVDTLVGQMRHFAAWIRGDVAPVSDIERGYAIQRIVNAAYQSASSGSPVLLRDDV
jgi:predicted dehydrogenase